MSLEKIYEQLGSHEAFIKMILKIAQENQKDIKSLLAFRTKMLAVGSIAGGVTGASVILFSFILKIVF